MSSLKFGTSGLRGLVVDLQGLPARQYAFAFLRHMTPSDEVVIGRDLRSSSAAIAGDCAAAVKAAGCTPIDCGALPTPALALEAQRRGCAGIMVTGSHIPDDRNGLKFYRPDGEITKADETAIAQAHADLTDADRAALAEAGPTEALPLATALELYLARYVDFFDRTALKGLRVGIYQHSSVARDLLVEILAALGAETVPLGRAASFIPVDTEAHRPEDVALVSDWVRAERLDVLVSTDGDADRPLIADDNGNILRGDVVGLLTARLLGLDTIVTPITSGQVVERSGIARHIVRTRVGSPYVIAGMEAAAHNVIGFEANGGVLLGSDVVRAGRKLSALPTRDAVLPIVSILSLVAETGQALSAIVDALDVGFAEAGRLQNVPAEFSSSFLLKLVQDRSYADAHFLAAGKVRSMSDVDGVRVQIEDGSTIHYRASGNAPELRCYVEARRGERSAELLAWGLQAARRALEHS